MTEGLEKANLDTSQFYEAQMEPYVQEAYRAKGSAQQVDEAVKNYIANFHLTEHFSF